MLFHDSPVENGRNRPVGKQFEVHHFTWSGCNEGCERLLIWSKQIKSILTKVACCILLTIINFIIRVVKLIKSPASSFETKSFVLSNKECFLSTFYGHSVVNLSLSQRNCNGHRKGGRGRFESDRFWLFKDITSHAFLSSFRFLFWRIAKFQFPWNKKGPLHPCWSIENFIQFS